MRGYTRALPAWVVAAGSGPDGTSLGPVRTFPAETGHAPLSSETLGDRPVSIRDLRVHSAPCRPLHHGHHRGGGSRTLVGRLSCGCSPVELRLCVPRLGRCSWICPSDLRFTKPA